MKYTFTGKKRITKVTDATFHVKQIRLNFYLITGDESKVVSKIYMERRCIGCYRLPKVGDNANAVMTLVGNKIAYDCCIDRILLESGIGTVE